jgi:hypothetical protein
VLNSAQLCENPPETFVAPESSCDSSADFWSAIGSGRESRDTQAGTASATISATIGVASNLARGAKEIRTFFLVKSLPILVFPLLIRRAK